MKITAIHYLAAIALLITGSEASGNTSTDSFAPVFPIPQEAEYLDGFFNLNEETVVLLPMKPSGQDSFLAQLLISELAENFDLILSTENAQELSGRENYILIGSAANPLVREYSAKHDIPLSSGNPGEEGYFMEVTKNAATVLGSDGPGTFYGLQSMRQLINREDAERIQCANIKDWPHMPFRGIHVYVPGPENITFFKRFIRDFMAYFKFNNMILEVNATMRLDRHPELNAGSIELHKDLVYTRRRAVTGPNGENMDSAHDRVGDGRVLDKEQIADLVNYARQFNIRVIPEIPSLTHSFYLLNRHRELAEIQEAEWPDTYCPLHPASYELYFDVLNEYIEVMDPEIIHIGHDEWRMAVNVCERCRGKDYSDLFIQDVLKIHDYLSARNIRVAMWGDHFVESHAGRGMPERQVEETGYSYRKPGALSPDQVREHIPKDILIFNWSWKSLNNRPGEQNTENFQEWGFEQVLGNFNAEILNFGRRSLGTGLLGGEVSAWTRTCEADFGQNRTQRFVSSANHLWSTHYPDREGYMRIIQGHMPQIRMYLKGERPPSGDGNPIQPLDISPSFNTLNTDQPLGIPFEHLKTGSVNTKNVKFELAETGERANYLCASIVETYRNSKTQTPARKVNIPVNEDASSLIFLHASAHRAGCGELLGWYRVVYEDGFEHLIPVQYGVNIREWHLWGKDPRTDQPDPCIKEGSPYCTTRAIFCGNLCYGADILNCSGNTDRELNFFAYEWKNPRFGIKINEIRLEGVSISGESTADIINRRLWKKDLYLGSQGLSDQTGELIEDNAIALIGISTVTKRDVNGSRAK